MAKYLDLTGMTRFWNAFKTRLLPSGGTSGQVLAKSSGTDYDVTWVNQSGGGGGGAYTPDEYPLTTLSGTGTLQFYAFGGTATLMCSGTTPSGAWDSTTLCTVPAGYRPQMTLYFAVAKTGSAVSDSYVQVSDGGTVTLQNWGGTQAAREFRCTATWAYHSSGLSNASGVSF